MGLGHFSPGAAGVGAMDNNRIHSAWATVGANGPHFATTDELNLAEPNRDLASETFTRGPGQREGRVRRFLVLPVRDRQKFCEYEHCRYRLLHLLVPETHQPVRFRPARIASLRTV